MSIAEIERFAADLESSEAMRAAAEKAKAQSSKATPMDRLAAFAAAKGYAFTASELKQQVIARAKSSGKELSEADLERIAGGGHSEFVDLLSGGAAQYMSGEAANKP